MSLSLKCDSCWRQEPFSENWRVVEVRQPTENDEANLLHDLFLCPECAYDLGEWLGLQGRIPYLKGTK